VAGGGVHVNAWISEYHLVQNACDPLIKINLIYRDVSVCDIVYIIVNFV